MRKIYGLCGYAQTGKDTTGLLLTGSKRIAFADALKKEVAKMLIEVGIVDNVWGEGKFFWRDFLVFWGKKRREIDADYWIKQALLKVSGLEKDQNIVFTDVRYLNEVNFIQAMGGTVIRILRPGYPAANEEEAVEMIKIVEAFPELPVIENKGTIGDLLDELKRVQADE